MMQALAWQIGRVLLGYVAGVAASVLVFLTLIVVLSFIMPQSQLWDFMALGVIFIFAFPAAVLFGIWLVFVLSWLPALLAVVLGEAFKMTALWVHLTLSVIVSLATGLFFYPDWITDVTFNKVMISLCYVLSALLAGLVYWSIAGRHAGQWRVPVPAEGVSS